MTQPASSQLELTLDSLYAWVAQLPRERRYLFAVDPGLLTGAALLDITSISDNGILKLGSWELTVDQYFDMAEAVISGLGPDVEVVIEDFHITKRTSDLSEAPWSLQLIGATMFLVRRFNALDFVLQSPGDKPFASNEKLRKVGFWHVGGEGHANDAYRHAMVYINNRYPRWSKYLLV
jgi:hypothetical protein